MSGNNTNNHTYVALMHTRVPIEVSIHSVWTTRNQRIGTLSFANAHLLRFTHIINEINNNSNLLSKCHTKNGICA